MYHDLREVFWWNDMKNDIADFVGKCPNCEQVKLEYQKPEDSAEDYAKLYINERVMLHGVPLSINSNKGPQFTPHFRKSFQKGLGTQKCMGDLASIVPLESVVVKDSLTYEEVPVEILDRQQKTTKTGEPRRGLRTMFKTMVHHPHRGSHPTNSGPRRSPSQAVDHLMSHEKVRGGSTEPPKA
ncbi:hypothetical protein MTR67_031306 [Solanum verrucosum]|uniref:Integrase zinc-binding domain-containing protein n=1 Tax=Solanum verrucosum TaxID=315347 RepID=A0AAF0ZDJ1_SOLVR|nr:hypothetical protein MTR67_031306 [Solanum verrucosum]